MGRVRIVVLDFGGGEVLAVLVLARFSSLLCLGSMVWELFCSWLWFPVPFAMFCCCWIAWSFWYSMYLPSLIETPRTGEVSYSERERLR